MARVLMPLPDEDFDPTEVAVPWKLGRYYRTYDAYVEDEVRAALGAGRFERGPTHLVTRGTRDDPSSAFVVEDGNYLSARWPGDAYALGARLVERLDAAR